MERLVAYCGLVCSACEAFKATQANDRAELERVAARWREEYNAPGITVESVVCDGCIGAEGNKCSHCGECGIRRCAMEKGVSTCAACEAYACAQLTEFFGMVPDARAVLEGLRVGD